jgi:hypothetical protein
MCKPSFRISHMPPDNPPSRQRPTSSRASSRSHPLGVAPSCCRGRDDVLAGFGAAAGTARLYVVFVAAMANEALGISSSSRMDCT